MNKSLFHISANYAELMTSIEENEGVLSEEQNEALEINEAELQEKAGNYIEFIGDRAAFIGRIDDEIKRLQALKKVNNNLVDRLKNSLLNAVNLFGAFEVGLHKIGTRKSEVLVLDDDFITPDQFKKIKVDTDKAAIKAAIKAGSTIEGAQIQTKLNISIK